LIDDVAEAIPTKTISVIFNWNQTLNKAEKMCVAITYFSKTKLRASLQKSNGDGENQTFVLNVRVLNLIFLTLHITQFCF
jgi:hypothetical protein